MATLSNKGGNSRRRIHGNTTRSAQLKDFALLPEMRSDPFHHVTTASYDPSRPGLREADIVRSHISEEGIIRRTDGWSVRYDDDEETGVEHAY